MFRTYEGHLCSGCEELSSCNETTIKHFGGNNFVLLQDKKEATRNNCENGKFEVRTTMIIV
jgi:hypothetical protein